MQNDSLPIDFSRPVLWWYSVRIAVAGAVGGQHKTMVRAKNAAHAQELARGIRDCLRWAMRSEPIVIKALEEKGGRWVARFAGYADE